MFCIQDLLYSSCIQNIEEENITNNELKSPWNEVKNFEHCLETMEQYLKGNITETPIYPQPLEDETKLILEELVILNKLGFLSINSQPASFSLFKNDELFSHSILPTDSTMLYKNEKYHLLSQWGYVSGFIKLDDGSKKILDLLNAYDDIQYCIEKVSETDYHYKYYSSDSKRSIPLNKIFDPNLEDQICGLKLTNKYTFNNDCYYNKAFLDISEPDKDDMDIFDKIFHNMFGIKNHPEVPILYTFKQCIDYPKSVRYSHQDMINGETTNFISNMEIDNRKHVNKIRFFDNKYYQPSKDDSLYYIILIDKNLGERWDRIFRILIQVLCVLKNIQAPSPWKRETLRDYKNSTNITKRYTGNFTWEYLSDFDKKITLF